MNEGSFSRMYIEQQGRAGANSATYANDRILCRAINRFKMFVSAKDMTVGPHLVLDGIWESWVTACLFNQLRGGMRCMNIGANVGYFTLIMGDLVGQNGHVWALECNPETFGLCRDNVILNGMDSWVQVLAKAGGAGPGKVAFQFTDSAPGSACVVRDEGQPDWKHIEVETTSVDDVVQDAGLDFLMVDAEGSEPAIIEGAHQTINNNPQLQILLEWAPGGWGPQGGHRLAKKLLGLGFEPLRVGTQGERQPITPPDLLDIETWDMIWFRKRPEIK